MRVLNPRTSWRSFLSATRRAQTGRASSTLTDTFDEPMSGSSKVKIFDRDLKRKQRDRAAWLMNPADTFVDTVAENLLDRLEDCRKSFPTALCLGGSLNAVRRLLNGRGGIEKLIMMDTSYDMVKICKENEEMSDNIETSYLVGDEEFLPVKDSSLDLVISCLGLHWTNDLPGALIQSRLALKPDGLFLGAILGGQTLKLFIWFIYRFPSIMLLFLHYIIMLLPLKNVSLCFSTSHQVLCCLFVRELRIACTLAHMEREGGISPRLSPLAQVRDAGNLLTRAGFSLPGVDADEYTVKYKDAFQLIEHLRAMGETNALVQRNTVLNRDTALATAAIYQSMFGEEDGTVPATYQVIYMTGWREHPSHQKARARGSATISFQDLQKQLGNEQ